MASKYTEYWDKVFQSISIPELREKGTLVISLTGLTSTGSRANWHGKSTFTSTGRSSGDIIAHTNALKYTIPGLLQEGDFVSATVNTKGDKLTLVMEKGLEGLDTIKSRIIGQLTEIMDRK